MFLRECLKISFFFCLITALTPLKVVREEGCGVLNIRAVC